LWTSFDYISNKVTSEQLAAHKEAGHEREFQDDLVVGGIIDVRMFAYPEGPKFAMKWTMRTIMSNKDRLKNIPYPDPSSQMSIDPVQVMYDLPPYVFTSDKDDI